MNEWMKLQERFNHAVLMGQRYQFVLIVLLALWVWLLSRKIKHMERDQ